MLNIKQYSEKKINAQGKSVKYGKSGQLRIRTGVRAGAK